MSAFLKRKEKNKEERKSINPEELIKNSSVRRIKINLNVQDPKINKNQVLVTLLYTHNTN